MTDRDLFKLTHEELADMIGRLERDRAALEERFAGVQLVAAAGLAKLELRRADVVAVEVDRELSDEERRSLSCFLAGWGADMSLRFLVLPPALKARLARRCEVCGKAKK
jgi:hypothetical protein